MWSATPRLRATNGQRLFVFIVLWLGYSTPASGRVIINEKTVPLSRSSRSVQEPGKIGCIDMESLPGDYWYESTGGSTVCGFYLIGLTNQLIEIEFVDFDINCEEGGLLATLDGWETRGQIFPSAADHPLSMDERYNTFCGEKKPSRMFVSSQNVALIQYRIPKRGQGFRVVIRFIENPQPCNVVSLEARGSYTLKNFGEKRNCSVSFLYPESFSILSLDVGKTGLLSIQNWETGIVAKCAKEGFADYVQFLGGEGLDTSIMAPALDVCGLDSNPVLPPVMIGCTHSVVRLVSSGNFYNSVNFVFQTFSDRYQHGTFKHCLLE